MDKRKQHQDHQDPISNATLNKTMIQTKLAYPKHTTLSQQLQKETINYETYTYAQAKTNQSPLKKSKATNKTHTSYPNLERLPSKKLKVSIHVL